MLSILFSYADIEITITSITVEFCKATYSTLNMSFLELILYIKEQRAIASLRIMLQ